ncbi:hypothetical protein [Sphingomonas sp. Leaf412]|uniref:hypothetical protein n=1 Tax=Sphingomonas sp. Leaf412 TaxID=1736370 RepID=UPI000B2F10D5|nr:hypothetical protein [Sphingomonas sp. Leaf412]
MRMLISLVLVVTGATQAGAQDYDPSMAAYDSMSQQQFRTQQSQIEAMALRKVIDRNNGRRIARTGATRQQVAACNGKARLRAEYCADNPKVRRLYGLCRSIGR